MSVTSIKELQKKIEQKSVQSMLRHDDKRKTNVRYGFFNRGQLNAKTNFERFAKNKSSEFIGRVLSK